MDIEEQYSKMVASLVKPGNVICAEMTPEKAHALHMAVGLLGELCELLECENDILQFTWNDQLSDGTNEDRIQWLSNHWNEEVGDYAFYATALRTIWPCAVTFDVAMRGLSLNRIVAEAGEILDAVKKWVIYNDTRKLDDIPLMLARNIAYMCTLLLNYKLETGVGRRFSLPKSIAGYRFKSWHECVADNKAKLSKRYGIDLENLPSVGYSDAAAQARVDKNESGA